jgi:hypothetical protein
MTSTPVQQARASLSSLSLCLELLLLKVRTSLYLSSVQLLDQHASRINVVCLLNKGADVPNMRSKKNKTKNKDFGVLSSYLLFRCPTNVLWSGTPTDT